ncbi:MAG: thiamine phosphate synthase [Anaerolineae bacterium]
MDCTLYVITDAKLSRGRSHLEVAQATIEGGASIIQFRDKQMSTRQLVETARKIKELTDEASIPLIINDRLDVALAVDADGVHVGQDDMPAALARQLIGPHKILGVSASTVEEALQAEREGADYVSASPVFTTPTKPDAPPPTGLEGLKAIVEAVNLPVIAIGGINEKNAAEVIEAGAQGIAVISAVISAPDIVAAARYLRETVEAARKGI